MPSMAGFYRMNVRQLEEYCRSRRIEFKRYGTRVYKSDLVEAVRRYHAAASTVFGHARVDVEKNTSALCWEVLAPDSERKICRVPWRLVFTFDEEMVHVRDRHHHRAALEACLSVEPLTPEEVAEVHRRWPATQGVEPYEVDETEGVWELQSTPTPSRPRTPAPAAEEPEAEPETRQLSLDRKISI